MTYYKGTVGVFKSYDGSGVVVWTIEFEFKTRSNGPALKDLVQSAISDWIYGMETDPSKQ